MWLETLVPSYPPSSSQLLVVVFLHPVGMFPLAKTSHQHVSVSRTRVSMGFPLHSRPNQILTLKALFPNCLVFWCPAITFQSSCFAASWQMFLFVCLFNSCSVCALELSPSLPFSLSYFHLSAWLVCHPVGLDGFILFPLNQNKPLSHEITHWSKSGPGLGNQIAEEF